MLPAINGNETGKLALGHFFRNRDALFGIVLCRKKYPPNNFGEGSSTGRRDLTVMGVREGLMAMHL